MHIASVIKDLGKMDGSHITQATQTRHALKRYHSFEGAFQRNSCTWLQSGTQREGFSRGMWTQCCGKH